MSAKCRYISGLGRARVRAGRHPSPASLIAVSLLGESDALTSAPPWARSNNGRHPATGCSLGGLEAALESAPIVKAAPKVTL